MAGKAPLYFRAVKATRGSGPLCAQFSHDGHLWHPSVEGLEVSDVRKEFTRLKKRGAQIIDTPEYAHAS